MRCGVVVFFAFSPAQVLISHQRSKTENENDDDDEEEKKEEKENERREQALSCPLLFP